LISRNFAEVNKYFIVTTSDLLVWEEDFEEDNRLASLSQER